MTLLLFGTAQDAWVPKLDGSGATAAVLGAYIVLCPASRVLTRIFPVFLVRIPGWIFRGQWRSMAQHHGILLACKGSRMPATKMRIGLVSGMLNTDMTNQY